VDPFDAMLNRDLGVFGGSNAFERERDLELVLDALDGAPIERRLEAAARHPASPRGLVAFGDIALAAAVQRGIDGKAECQVAVGDRAADIVVDESVIPADIELKNARRIGGGLGDPLEPRL